jgi:hypothetical protein
MSGSERGISRGLFPLPASEVCLSNFQFSSFFFSSFPLTFLSPPFLSVGRIKTPDMFRCRFSIREGSSSAECQDMHTQT